MFWQGLVWEEDVSHLDPLMRQIEVCGALGCMAETACAKAWFGLERWVEVGTIQLPHDELVGSKNTRRLPTLLLSYGHGNLGLPGARHPALVP